MKTLKVLVLATFITASTFIPFTASAQTSDMNIRMQLFDRIMELIQQVRELQQTLDDKQAAENDNDSETQPDAEAPQRNVVVTSPEEGDFFGYGDNMRIQWTPKNVGISKIKIVSKDDNLSPIIYSKKAHSYDPNYTGHFDYEVSSVDPGTHHVELTTVSGEIIESEEFTVGQNVEVLSPDGRKYKTGEDLGIKWTPKEVGVEEIKLVSEDGNTSPIIYAKKVFGYDTNYSGNFTYEVSNVLVPGAYHVELTTAEGREVVGGNFEIVGPDETSSRDEQIQDLREQLQNQ